MTKKIKVIISVFVLFLIIYFFRIDLRLRYYLNTSDVIIYGNNISINDFKSNRKSKRSNILYTHGFGCVYNSGVIPFINCFSYFEPNNSWIKKPLDEKTKLDFKFHSIIFKVNELYARKLEFKMKRLIDNNKKPTFDGFLSEHYQMTSRKDSLKREIENDDYNNYQEKVEKWTKWIDNELNNCCN